MRAWIARLTNGRFVAWWLAVCCGTPIIGPFGPQTMTFAVGAAPAPSFGTSGPPTNTSPTRIAATWFFSIRFERRFIASSPSFLREGPSIFAKSPRAEREPIGDGAYFCPVCVRKTPGCFASSLATFAGIAMPSPDCPSARTPLAAGERPLAR